ncbi:MAG: flagellar basal body-associated FliL family protein [Alphaproteobacteria bacterium]|nr:flagellar basal body-associated FliL family protein [Alphaproteobacteria bacterium]QQS55999.1 MAG: flagellar basal body-associated FliL family protein [Alphaproteobacteria bacterium]
MAKDEEEPKEGAEEGAEGQPADGEKPKAGLKKILMIVIPVVLLLGGGAGLYFTGMLDSLLGAKKEEGGEHAAAEGEHGAAPAEGEHAAPAEGGHGEAAEGGHGEAGGAFLEIPTMIVNLESDDGSPRYLRLTVQLELENPADKPAVEAVTPRVVDQFQTYLRELRVRDLRGSAGIYRLQMELLSRVNQAAAPVKIKDVLFQEILIQ